MKRVTAPELYQYRNDPRILLANAPDGAALSLPLTLPSDILFVEQRALAEVYAIRHLLATLGLDCVSRKQVFSFGPDRALTSQRNKWADLRVSVGRYGEDAKNFSKKIEVPMEGSARVRNTAESLTIADLRAIEVTTLRQAHSVANAILALVPVENGRPGIKVTAVNGEETKPKSFKEFSDLVSSLLDRDAKCLVGVANCGEGSLRSVAVVQIGVTDDLATDFVCSITDCPVDNLAISRDVTTSKFPAAVRNTAALLGLRGYRGFASVVLAEAEGGNVIPLSITPGVTVGLAATFTAAKVFARDFAVPQWGIARQKVTSDSTTAETVVARLEKERVFFSKGARAGIIPLTLPDVTKPTLNYIVLAKNTSDVQRMVEKVAGILK